MTATTSGRLFRWPTALPMTGTPEDCERRLEARLGITFAGGDAVLLTPEAWHASLRSKRESESHCSPTLLCRDNRDAGPFGRYRLLSTSERLPRDSNNPRA